MSGKVDKDFVVLSWITDCGSRFEDRTFGLAALPVGFLSGDLTRRSLKIEVDEEDPAGEEGLSLEAAGKSAAVPKTSPDDSAFCLSAALDGILTLLRGLLQV